jgi:hypothetical protein
MQSERSRKLHEEGAKANLAIGDFAHRGEGFDFQALSVAPATAEAHAEIEQALAQQVIGKIAPFFGQRIDLFGVVEKLLEDGSAAAVAADNRIHAGIEAFVKPGGALVTDATVFFCGRDGHQIW